MRYLPFHGGNTGSNPVRVAILLCILAFFKAPRLCGTNFFHTTGVQINYPTSKKKILVFEDRSEH